jgi:hypothetical protein
MALIIRFVNLKIQSRELAYANSDGASPGLLTVSREAFVKLRACLVM